MKVKLVKWGICDFNTANMKCIPFSSFDLLTNNTSLNEKLQEVHVFDNIADFNNVSVEEKYRLYPQEGNVYLTEQGQICIFPISSIL